MAYYFNLQLNQFSADINLISLNHIRLDNIKRSIFNKTKRDIAIIGGVDEILLASIVIPRQRQRLRTGRDRRRRPAIEQRWPVASGGSRMLPVTSQSGTTSSGCARPSYTDTDSHANTTGGGSYYLLRIHHTARLDNTSLVYFHFLVRRSPVLIVHEVMRVRGRRRGRRR